MDRLPVRKVTGEVFVHESEDYESVKKAFSLFFPEKAMRKDEVPASLGTSVRIIRAEVSGKSAKELLRKLLGSLSSADRNRILDELTLRLSEEGGLYLRFDKQEAFNDKVVLTGEEEDSIQVVLMLEAFPANVANFYRSAKMIFE